MIEKQSERNRPDVAITRPAMNVSLQTLRYLQIWTVWKQSQENSGRANRKNVSSDSSCCPLFAVGTLKTISNNLHFPSLLLHSWQQYWATLLEWSHMRRKMSLRCAWYLGYHYHHSAKPFNYLFVTSYQIETQMNVSVIFYMLFS